MFMENSQCGLGLANGHKFLRSLGPKIVSNRPIKNKSFKCKKTAVRLCLDDKGEEFLTLRTFSGFVCGGGGMLGNLLYPTRPQIYSHSWVGRSTVQICM